VADWADWLVTHGQADAQSVAEAERVLEAAALQPGDTVLDVGAGLGLLTLAAHERIGDGWVIAVDPSVGALEELLRLAHDVGSNGIMYLIGDAEVLPLPDASVDAAILRSVLVHVDDVPAALEELARVLRPNGRLSAREPLNRGATYLATAVDWSPLGELGDRIRAEWDSFAAGDPLQQLDPDELVAQLEDAGFISIERSLEDPGEEWAVTDESVDARLDARGSPTAPSARERWREAFGADALAAIEAHLKSLAGTTVIFRRPQLFLSARRP
jgi:ubiquinone/menaquinone biosynthesis C-methylase UbiE